MPVQLVTPRSPKPPSTERGQAPPSPPPRRRPSAPQLDQARALRRRPAAGCPGSTCRPWCARRAADGDARRGSGWRCARSARRHARAGPAGSGSATSRRITTASSRGSRWPRRSRPCPARGPRAPPRRRSPSRRRRELDEHRQVHAGHDLDLRRQEGQAHVGGRAPEHVGEDEDVPAAHLRERAPRWRSRGAPSRRRVQPMDTAAMAGISPTMVRAAFTSSLGQLPVA